MNIGDTVKVVSNLNKHLPMPPGIMGKEGKIIGALTPSSCRVKVPYADAVWVEFRELELIKAAPEAPVAAAPNKRKRKDG